MSDTLRVIYGAGDQVGGPVFSGARILMTGLTGQVGAPIARGLAADNQVFGLARFSAPGSYEAAVAAGIEAIRCDYVEDDLSPVPRDIDYVVHVAADTDPATFDEGVRQNAEGVGRLLDHCRAARAWFYTSTTGVYWDHPDPYYRYRETDRCGGSTRITKRFHYGTSKVIGEGVARAFSRVHNVPLVIARLNWSYGSYGTGGLPGVIADHVINGRPIDVHPDWDFVGSPIHEDDLLASIGPFLAAAVVGGRTVNWAGDDAITNVQLAEFVGELIGRRPVFRAERAARAYPRATDNSVREQIYGACRVEWRAGMRRLLDDRYPGLVPADGRPGQDEADAGETGSAAVSDPSRSGAAKADTALAAGD